jgi:hypothetical protein
MATLTPNLPSICELGEVSFPCGESATLLGSDCEEPIAVRQVPHGQGEDRMRAKPDCLELHVIGGGLEWMDPLTGESMSARRQLPPCCIGACPARPNWDWHVETSHEPDTRIQRGMDGLSRKARVPSRKSLAGGWLRLGSVATVRVPTRTKASASSSRDRVHWQTEAEAAARSFVSPPSIRRKIGRRSPPLAVPGQQGTVAHVDTAQVYGSAAG